MDVATESRFPESYAANAGTYSCSASVAAVAYPSAITIKQAEKELYEATSKRLVEEQRVNNPGVKETAYHQATGIEAAPGAPKRNGDVLVPGYDVDGNRTRHTCAAGIAGRSGPH
jgi:hypothetical protein